MDAGKLRASLLSDDEERRVLALLLGGDHHLLDGARDEGVHTCTGPNRRRQRTSKALTIKKRGPQVWVWQYSLPLLGVVCLDGFVNVLVLYSLSTDNSGYSMFLQVTCAIHTLPNTRGHTLTHRTCARFLRILRLNAVKSAMEPRERHANHHIPTYAFCCRTSGWSRSACNVQNTTVKTKRTKTHTVPRSVV